MLSFGISYALCWFVSLVYPTYASYKALASPSSLDDAHWLTYWVVYSLLSTAELILETFFAWFPLYYEAKLIFVLWLIIPQSKGAQYIFEQIVKPLMIKYGSNIDPAFASAEKVIYSQHTAMIVDIANKYGQEVAKLAIQRAAEEAPKIARASGSGQYNLPQSQNAGYGSGAAEHRGSHTQNYRPMSTYAQ
ncbi:hypothetical protein WJX73_001541 [Symbiochloris irregularis]|uniref:HVA22-like protein n=1 Tax=Symbiochloris irregularis TaxID=706552 RepID=A0AAW1NYU6_9CHLO